MKAEKIKKASVLTKNILRGKEGNMYTTLMVIFMVVYLIALFTGIGVALKE